jgi:hypothetical protein
MKQKHEAYRVGAIILFGTGCAPQQFAELLL